MVNGVTAFSTLFLKVALTNRACKLLLKLSNFLVLAFTIKDGKFKYSFLYTDAQAPASPLPSNMRYYQRHYSYDKLGGFFQTMLPPSAFHEDKTRSFTIFKNHF